MKHILFVILVLFVSITFYGIDDLIDEPTDSLSLIQEEKATDYPAVPEQDVYKTHVNDRFYFCVDYPANFLFPQPPPDNGDGLKFLSMDGESYMIASGINALDETLEMAYKNNLRETDYFGVKRTITYHRKAKNFYIVSGYKEGKIFYTRRYLRDGVFRSLNFVYPRSEKYRFDRIIAHVVKTFPHCQEK